MPPAASVPESAAGLARARTDIAGVAAPDCRLAAAGAHPFSAPEGPVHPAPRYEQLEEEFGAVIRHQLLFGLGQIERGSIRLGDGRGEVQHEAERLQDDVRHRLRLLGDDLGVLSGAALGLQADEGVVVGLALGGDVAQQHGHPEPFAVVADDRRHRQGDLHRGAIRPPQFHLLRWGSDAVEAGVEHRTGRLEVRIGDEGRTSVA